jgi:Sec-independent protein translocase protein TatA
VSFSEILFLGLLGPAIFGPRKLVEFAQQAGKTLARLRRISGEFQTQLATEISQGRMIAGCNIPESKSATRDFGSGSV